MKFALANEAKTEAQPGLKGNCIFCQSATISKCGSVKIWHWAHKSKMPCDPWWENEAEWHRAWKNRFPTDWQEKSHTDSATGEKHIADIKTDKELVIEFQHSAIKPDEIKSREAFYKNMVWVVDGTRLKKDYPRFCDGFSNLKPFFKQGFFLSRFPTKCFPVAWLTSSVPVYFDFQGIDLINSPDMKRSTLWCLFPSVEGHVLVAGVSREQFRELASVAPDKLFVRELHNFIPEYLQHQRKIAATHAVPRQYTRRHRRL